MGVSFTRHQPCPVCGGYNEAPRGAGVRCYGKLSDDKIWAFCTREEHAGGLPLHENSGTYVHRLHGDCRCSVAHADAPRLREPSASQPRTRVRSHRAW
jgi:hypothetical protein